MGKVEDAKNIQELSDSAMALMLSSLASYQKVSVSVLESFTGGKVMDATECGKNFQLWMGTAAKDLGNINTVWQQVMKVITPAPAAPNPAGAGTASGGATKKATTAKKTANKAGGVKKATKKGP